MSQVTKEDFRRDAEKSQVIAVSHKKSKESFIHDHYQIVADNKEDYLTLKSNSFTLTKDEANSVKWDQDSQSWVTFNDFYIKFYKNTR